MTYLLYMYVHIVGSSQNKVKYKIFSHVVTCSVPSSYRVIIVTSLLPFYMSTIFIPQLHFAVTAHVALP